MIFLYQGVLIIIFLKFPINVFRRYKLEKWELKFEHRRYKSIIKKCVHSWILVMKHHKICMKHQDQIQRKFLCLIHESQNGTQIHNSIRMFFRNPKLILKISNKSESWVFQMRRCAKIDGKINLVDGLCYCKDV
ncbi:unnamed protein product [Prunus armeniaca]